MGFTVVAVALGVAAGLATGGRFRNMRGTELRAVGALGAAVALQVVAEVGDVGGALGLTCILASYGLLLGFGLANVRLVGMPVVLVGLLLNAAVITVNGGMPVRAEAVRTIDRGRDPSTIGFGAKRHLESPDDTLTFLGDILPVAPLDQVLSFGDLILSAGVADVLFRLLRPHRTARKRTNESEEPLVPSVDVPMGSFAR